jgi:hypothetical protein
MPEKGAPYGGTGGSQHEVPPQKEGGSSAMGPPRGVRSNHESKPKSAVNERKSESFRKNTVGGK